MQTAGSREDNNFLVVHISRTPMQLQVCQFDHWLSEEFLWLLMGLLLCAFQSASSSTSAARAPPSSRALWWRTTRCGRWVTMAKCRGETRWKQRSTPTGPSGRASRSPPPSTLNTHSASNTMATQSLLAWSKVSASSFQSSRQTIMTFLWLNTFLMTF